ncbi:MAG: flagellar motor switch protein FliN [SAR324 cluster bacterium]|nr:flagellar motor switch protein FliN [SAR324 cluster bacterium]
MAESRTDLLGGDSYKKFLQRGDEEDVYHNIKFLEDVPMILHVEIGRADMTIRDILNLKAGSVIPFTKIVGEPMDILVAERLMARGEVVVVNERYGIRISEVTRPDEKIGDRRE